MSLLLAFCVLNFNVDSGLATTYGWAKAIKQEAYLSLKEEMLIYHTSITLHMIKVIRVHNKYW